MTDTPLKNRMLKKAKQLRKWAKNEGTDAFRLIHWDIPEYPYYIDLYGPCAVISIVADSELDTPEKIECQLQEIKLGLKELGIKDNEIFIKERRRQSGPSQYQRLNHSTYLSEVKEGQALFQVNLS